MTNQPVEVVRVTEEQLADLVEGDAVEAPLPYHYPKHPPGVCAGCDARTEAEANARTVVAA